jgi:hypothetical protein
MMGAEDARPFPRPVLRRAGGRRLDPDARPVRGNGGPNKILGS